MPKGCHYKHLNLDKCGKVMLNLTLTFQKQIAAKLF